MAVVVRISLSAYAACACCNCDVDSFGPWTAAFPGNGARSVGKEQDQAHSPKNQAKQYQQGKNIEKTHSTLRKKGSLHLDYRLICTQFCRKLCARFSSVLSLSSTIYLVGVRSHHIVLAEPYRQKTFPSDVLGQCHPDNALSDCLHSSISPFECNGVEFSIT